jgi:hypothetical protein
LHNSGALNLYAIAGRFTSCEGKATWEQFDGEAVYTGTRTKVTKTDLDDFLSLGPSAVPSFTACGIRRDTFRRHQETARRKGFQLGLNFTWLTPTDVVVADPQFVPPNRALAKLQPFSSSAGY